MSLLIELEKFEQSKQQLVNKPIRTTVNLGFKTLGTALVVIDQGLDMVLDEVMLTKLEHKQEVLDRLENILKPSKPTKTTKAKA